MAGIKGERKYHILHDAGGDTREETVKALKILIPTFRNKDIILPICQYLHKSKMS
jgi:hypothetical protein